MKKQLIEIEKMRFRIPKKEDCHWMELTEGTIRMDKKEYDARRDKMIREGTWRERMGPSEILSKEDIDAINTIMNDLKEGEAYIFVVKKAKQPVEENRNIRYFILKFSSRDIRSLKTLPKYKFAWLMKLQSIIEETMEI